MKNNRRIFAFRKVKRLFWSFKEPIKIRSDGEALISSFIGAGHQRLGFMMDQLSNSYSSNDHFFVVSNNPETIDLCRRVDPFCDFVKFDHIQSSLPRAQINPLMFFDKAEAATWVSEMFLVNTHWDGRPIIAITAALVDLRDAGKIYLDLEQLGNHLSMDAIEMLASNEDVSQASRRTLLHAYAYLNSAKKHKTHFAGMVGALKEKVDFFSKKYGFIFNKSAYSSPLDVRSHLLGKRNLCIQFSSRLPNEDRLKLAAFIKSIITVTAASIDNYELKDMHLIFDNAEDFASSTFNGAVVQYIKSGASCSFGFEDDGFIALNTFATSLATCCQMIFCFNREFLGNVNVIDYMIQSHEADIRYLPEDPTNLGYGEVIMIARTDNERILVEKVELSKQNTRQAA